jgi:hypothetical protein
MYIKRQQSESRLIHAMERLRAPGDDRPILLAYGAWRLNNSTVARRGNPPAIGVSLARRLAKNFLVIWTPEYMTSQTCLTCGSNCGRCAQVEEQRPKIHGRRCHIRGLRQCTNASCGHLFNREHMGAVNIARNLARQLDGLPLISQMSQDDQELMDLDNALHSEA